jgi:hypothetical protein
MQLGKTEGWVVMEREKYTNGDAMNILDNEGVGYAVQHYCSGCDFKDPETAKLWTAADHALTTLVEYLERDTGREL